MFGTKILNNHDNVSCDICGKPIKDGDAVWIRAVVKINQKSWNAEDLVYAANHRDGKRWCDVHGPNGDKNVKVNIFKRFIRKVRRYGY